MQMISIPLHSTTNSYHLGNNDEVVDAKGVGQQVTNYYPFGAPYADASATLNPSLQAYKYNGKELELMHGLNTYDHGARQNDPVLCRWDRIDPLCEKYYSTSPYAYCANNPINAIDPDGQKIYMLFYSTGNVTTGNNGQAQYDTDADKMFKTAALTRWVDIMKSGKFDPKKDIIVMQEFKNLGELHNLVNNIVNTYSNEYGKTAEFGIWSHSGLLDGPLGTQWVRTPNRLPEEATCQISLKGWSEINFNWDDNASAFFYGCRSGVVPENGKASFTTKISDLPNFKDVDVYGQTNYSYPSSSPTERNISVGMKYGMFTIPTYMVGSPKGSGSYWHNAKAYPMRKSRNGIGVVRRNCYPQGRH